MEYEKDSEEESSPLDERLGRGWTELESGDVDAARTLAVEVIEEGDADADALLLLAACEREDGDDDAALEVLAKAIEQDPEWATPHLWTAELLSMQGRGVEALKHARVAVELADDEDEFLSAVVFRATLELESDNPAAAKAALEELPPAEVIAGTPEIALEAAELHLALGQFDNGRALAKAVVDADDDEEAVADAWYTMGLIEEGAGEEKAKRRAWLKVYDSDAKMAHAKTGFISEEDEVLAMAQTAVEELPLKARKLLKNVPILVADVPSREEVSEGLDPRLLGVFRGTALPDTESLGSGAGLTQIVLYRNNLQRVAPDDASLADEVRTTLLAETGNFFGLDEEELAAMGLD